MKKSIKFLYDSIPFKKNIFTFIKHVWTPSESIYKHLHFKDVINVRVNDSSAFKIRHYGFELENEIFWKGLINGWEKESSRLWIKLCSQSSTILDIGANTGIYALVAKTVNPDAKVFAFEPVKRVFEKLDANIRLNAFDITAIEKAVSDEDGTAVIFDMPVEHVYSVTVNKNMLAPDAEVIKTNIETIRLDTFIRQYGLSNIDLIKIDVETHEAEVLAGFAGYLNMFKPTMLIEILSDEVGQKVEALLNGMGYLYFNIDENSGIRQVNTILKSDYYNYLVCNPAVAAELGLIHS